MKTTINIFAQRMTMTILLLCCTVVAMGESLTVNREYYIWLNIYEKLLGSNEAGTGPAISEFGTNADADSYVFVAESSGTDGYVLLRQKSSGKYLAASSSSSYSVVLESTSSTDNRYCWAVEEGTYTYLVNKKNSKYLGIDGAKKGNSYVNVYYDKPKGSHSQFSVIPAIGTWDEARQTYESPLYTNAQGIQEIDYCQLKDNQIDFSEPIDIHITANSNPILGSSSVNLGSDRTWLILDNIQPSEVISSYLKYVKIDGKAAKNGTNCRVAIYLNGAAIIPLPSEVITCTGTSGDFNLTVGNHSDLQAMSNTMTSFTLRRGYMATLASGTSGSGYSRVYVADHADLEVTLPKALNKRVTSVNIKQWQYVSKKGWGNTGGTSGGPQLRATWYWTWSAGYNSTTDMEFVPCRQHLYWPSATEVNNHTASASMSINEPEHSEQHESSDCSCGGTISEWKCYEITRDFLPSGGRIGSPQPTELGYLTNYCNYVDNMQSRCDFTVTHAYWDLASYDEAGYANWFCNTKCKSVWNNTGRPVWLSEMEISASWNGTKVKNYEDNRKYLQVLLQKIEECPWIERYAIYGTDMWQTYMFYDANSSKGLTPAGEVYRDHRATFAYNAKYTKEPTFWAPSVKTPTLAYTISASKGNITFAIGNGNGDCTETLVFQQKKKDGQWEDLYSVSDRSELEDTKFSYALSLDDVDIENDLFRVCVTTLFGGNATSEETAISYIANPDCDQASTTSWTVENLSTNKGQAWDGDENNNYFDKWNSGSLTSSMTQTITDLPAGEYQLSALLRCTNELNVNLQAAVKNSEGVVSVYSTRITGTGDGTVEGSPYLHGWQLATTPSFLLQPEEELTITASFAASQTAWWSADHFRLSYTPIALPGDVNNDGKINAEDLTILIAIYLGQLDATSYAADINNDGTITLTDITRFINLYLSGEK